jgi:hypothetical protein
MEKQDRPFQELGKALMDLRNQHQESAVEVSGAVEIDTDKLLQYEQGIYRPSEDILELLITHFAVKDDEADRLWKLAGYDDPRLISAEDLPAVQQPLMLLPFDARVIYTDSMNVVINNNGVVMNFMQQAGPNGQQLPAARVGMSLEHAKRIAQTLQETIKTATELNQTKFLPDQKPNNKSKNNSQ